MSIHFSILLIEPEGINYQLLKVILAKEVYHLHHFSCCSKAWNHIQTSKVPDMIIINSEFPKDLLFKITTEELLTLVSEKNDWNKVPIMLLMAKNKQNSSDFIKNNSIDSVIQMPFNPINFVNNIYYLLELGLQRHIDELNHQHLFLGKLLKQLIKNVHNKSNLLVLFKKMKKLQSIIIEHFCFEENYMKSHNYEALGPHQGNHIIILKLIKKILKKMQLMTHKKLHKKLIQLQNSIYGDINDDNDCIKFLEKARNDLITSITKK